MMSEYQLMLDDHLKAREPFKASDLVWTNICRDFHSKITSVGPEKLETFNSRFASYPQGDRHYEGYARHLGCNSHSTDWYTSACQAYFSHLKKRDTHGILAKDPKPSSWDWLTTCEELISILDVKPELLSSPQMVVDLGSGWGRIGSVLCNLNPRVTYVACDIPESLIIAQTHLPKYVNVPVHLYGESRNTLQFTHGVWFCGPDRLDTFKDHSVDVFINTFSFQEMTMTQVTQYFDVIDRVTRGVLYTQQRKRGDQLTQENYPYCQTWKNLFDRGVLFSPVYFEATFSINE